MKDEKQLIIELRSGSHEAFRQLFDSYKKRIYGFLYNMLHSHEDVEELLQVVFVKIWENRATMNHELSLDATCLKLQERLYAVKMILQKMVIPMIRFFSVCQFSFSKFRMRRLRLIRMSLYS